MKLVHEAFLPERSILRKDSGVALYFICYFGKKNHYLTFDTYIAIFIPQLVIITKSDIEHDLDRVYPAYHIRANTFYGRKKVRLIKYVFISKLIFFSFQY